MRIYAFIAGVLIADLVKQWKWKNKLCIHIYELIIIIAGILWFIEFEMFFRNATIRSAMELILICMLIHACTLEGGFFDKILSTKWNIRLGELTMYIYMVHYPVRLNLDVLWRNVFPRTLLGGIIESCVVIVITIAIIAWILKMEKRRAERKILKN